MERISYFKMIILIIIVVVCSDLCLAQTSFNISNKSTGDTLFTIDENGKVGIGTTAPVAKLEVLSSDPDQNGSIRIGNSDLSNYLRLYSGRSAFPDPFFMWNEGSALRFGTSFGSEFARLTSEGKLGIGTTAPTEMLEVADTIYSSVGGFKFPDGTVQATAALGGSSTWQQNGSDIYFNSGNVGIGTTSPSSGFHLSGTGYPNSFMFIEAASGNDAGLRLYENSTPKWHIFNNATLNGLQIYNTGAAQQVFFAEQSTGHVGIGTTSPNAELEIGGTDGVLFTGTYGSGSIPAEGEGTRMMWYPGKAAFRAGIIGVWGPTFWDDDSIGLGSFAAGINTKAKGDGSVALGSRTQANGTASSAVGNWTTAIGNSSTAIGYLTASGGNNSTAMGNQIRTNGEGSFAIGDNSSVTHGAFTTDNRFYARFANGYRLYTSADLTSGAEMLAGANSWSSISDSTKKENFKTVDGENVLNQISRFKLGSWNYIGQDPTKFRHYGPMAQQFYNAFGHDGIGVCGNDTTLASADVDGINMIAIQALEKRTSENKQITGELYKVIKNLEEENLQLKQQINSLVTIVNQLKTVLIKNQKQKSTNEFSMTSGQSMQ